MPTFLVGPLTNTPYDFMVSHSAALSDLLTHFRRLLLYSREKTTGSEFPNYTMCFGDYGW